MRQDNRRLTEDYKYYTDDEKMRELARSDADNLAKLFDEDVAEQAKLASAEAGDRRDVKP